MQKKSLVQNSIFFSANKLFHAIFPLVTSAYLARILLPEGIGIISIVQNFVTYFTYIAPLGMPTYGTREIARNRDSDKKNIVFTDLFLINLISTIICLLVYGLIIFNFDSFEYHFSLYIVYGSLILFNIINVDWVYQGMEEYRYISVRSFFVKVVSFVLILLFVRESTDYIVYAAISCLATVGNYIFNIFHLFHKKLVRFDFSHKFSLLHLKPLMVLFISSIAIELYTLVDTTMLGIMCEESVVGYYSNAMKIVKTVIMFFVAIAAVVAPQISNMYGQNNFDGIRKLTNKLFNILLTITVPSCVGLAMVSGEVISVLYGEEFLPSVVTLQILSALIIPITMSTFLGSYVLCSVNMEKKMLIATIMGAIVNVVANAFLIPLFNQNGAAFASFASEVVVFLFDLFFVCKVVKIRIERRNILSIVCGTLIMFFALSLFKFLSFSNMVLILLKVSFGVLLYCLSLVIFKNNLVTDLLNLLKGRTK